MGAKKDTNSFVKQGNFVFRSIVTTDIQKTLESTNTGAEQDGGLSVVCSGLVATLFISDHLYLALGTNPMSHFFGSKLFWRLDDHPSLGPFIDLLAYLEPDLCPNNPVLHKNPKTAKKRESPTGGLRGRR